MQDLGEQDMPNAAQMPISLTFHVLVERQADGTYLAHCLELDLVAEGDTPHNACKEVLNIMDVQVRTCIQNDNLENLFFPAPQEVWAKLGRAQSRCAAESHKRQFVANNRTVNIDQYCYA